MSARTTLFLLPALLLLLGVLVCGCEKEQDEAFTILVISDPHMRLAGNPDSAVYDAQQNRDNLEHMVDRINSEWSEAAFVMVTGDLVGTLYSADPEDYLAGDDNPAEAFLAVMSGLRIPWHAALGNHDYLEGYDPDLSEGITADTPADMEAVWQKVLGIEPYYTFTYGRWRIIVLNSNRGALAAVPCTGSSREAMCTGSFDQAQLTWLENLLQNPEPCLLFFHHPPVTDHNDAALWAYGLDSFQLDPSDGFYDIAERYRDRIKGIFVGHGHTWTRDTLYGTIPVFETGPLGDVGSNRDNVHIVRVSWEGDSVTATIGNPSAAYAFTP